MIVRRAKAVNLTGITTVIITGAIAITTGNGKGHPTTIVIMALGKDLTVSRATIATTATERLAITRPRGRKEAAVVVQ